MVTMTLDEIMAREPIIDRAKYDATTDDDIRRHMIEDGYDPDYEPANPVRVVPPRVVREQLGMTQEAFAAALTIPLEMLLDWETGRAYPDPGAQSLLRAVAKDPQAVLAALAA